MQIFNLISRTMSYHLIKCKPTNIINSKFYKLEYDGYSNGMDVSFILYWRVSVLYSKILF